MDDWEDRQRERAEQEEKERQLQQQLSDEDLKEVLSSASGRRVIWRLLTRAGVFRSSYEPCSHKTAFNEGWRNSGLFLLNEVLRLSPDAFTLMQKENTNVS